MSEHAGSMPTALNAQRWMPFRNDSGETAPGFAFMFVTGTAVVDGVEVLICEKEIGTSDADFWVINGPTQVANGKIGSCTFGPSHILYDTGTPAPGEFWKPKENWKIETGGGEVKIVGNPLDSGGGGQRVLAIPGSGARMRGMTRCYNNAGGADPGDIIYFGCTGSSGSTNDITYPGTIDNSGGRLTASGSTSITVNADGFYFISYSADVRFTAGIPSPSTLEEAQVRMYCDLKVKKNTDTIYQLDKQAATRWYSGQWYSENLQFTTCPNAYQLSFNTANGFFNLSSSSWVELAEGDVIKLQATHSTTIDFGALTSSHVAPSISRPHLTVSF